MSTDNFPLGPKVGSPFCSFATTSGCTTADVCELVTKQVHNAFNCLRVPEQGAPTFWFAPSSLPGSSPMPINTLSPRTHGITEQDDIYCQSTAFESRNANFNRLSSPEEQQRLMIANQVLYTQAISKPAHEINPDLAPSAVFTNQACGMPMQPPTMPLLTNQLAPSSEQAIRRQAYYRQRHHPNANQASTPGCTIDELKNKNRFSATACGDCTVVRDSKMSLSSAPPSPTAGTVGGSLGSMANRSSYNHLVHGGAPMTQGFMPSSSAYCTQPAASYSSTKKVSDMSTSSTLSSYSSSSLSSSSSVTGVSPRKRRADESNANSQTARSYNGCRVPNTSSTSEVTAGVNGVRLYDNSRVSPTCQIAQEWASEQHQHKRSKNDNADDDDVVFVSMEPAPKLPQQRLCENVSGKTAMALNPFASVPSHPVKSARRTKKGSSKRSTRPPSARVVSSSPVPGMVPSSSTLQQQKVTSGQAVFVAPGALTTSSAASNERYFLRSTAKRNGVDENNNTNNERQVLLQPEHGRKTQQGAHNVRYHTRSQQRRQKKTPAPVQQQQQQQHYEPAEQQITPQQVTVVSESQQNATEVKHLTVPPTSCVASTSAPTSVIRSAPAALNVDAQQRSSSAFKKIYDIRGIIGAGGGGTVYAGTRKSDNVQVAIKQVPKAKVKRWGKLDGRVVPIEFELLHRAATSGNKGVIGMLDWYERRNSYILVMERPQPVIDLFDYLNQHGALPENVARNIFRQIVEAVIHCHANGVVHRDIKDENVLLNLHTSEAKLIDFGCGTLMKEAPYTEFAGTPEFYPPEWFIERRYSGRRVDAWSLGVLLYTMVEAEVPFQKEKDIIACELRHKRAHAISDACRHLIGSMLCKDQYKRLTLENVLQHPWLTNGAMPPVSTPTSGIMNTREMYVSQPMPTYIPASPASPPAPEKHTMAIDPFQGPRYACQESPSFAQRVLTNHVVGPGSPVACTMQVNECIVRS
uniref:non-specific serine/threonine protein kinase n=1 Tax=Phallusia mammillata TaxID=59560 RepID=A0A6F9DN79_9ASCI|nr:serine/threonine-protein kinase pim-3-like [Phallusia mammillata]